MILPFPLSPRPLCSKNVSYKERVKLSIFFTFNVIVNHIFPEKFIENFLCQY